MATQVQNRRGTTAEHSTFTGAVGELTVDTTKDTVVVHDGAVAGGRPLLREDQSNLPTSAPTTGIYNASGSLAISTNSTERIRIDSSGGVGIGQVAPATRLSVVSFTPTSSNLDAVFNITNDVDSNFRIFVTGSGAADKRAAIGSTTSTSLAFLTNNTERMRLDSSGRLGIGTTSPNQPLEVNGTIRGGSYQFSDSGTSVASYIGFSNSNGPTAEFWGSASANAGSLLLKTAGSERARIDSSGRLLIGTSTSTADAIAVFLGRSSAPGGTGGEIKLAHPTTNVPASGTLGRIQFGNTTDDRGAEIAAVANQTWTSTARGSNLTFSTTADGASSPTERMRISQSGNLSVGVTSDSGFHELRKSGGSETSAIAGFSTSGSNLPVAIYQVTGAGANGAAAAMLVGRGSVTSRSINAGGTVNASGADYAEYMIKAGDFTIAKGDVCGVTADGQLTNEFAYAVSFVVKSTNPSYVGGDTWGSEDVVGAKPEADDADALVRWEADLEAARQAVDRIAFAGQVPVNVMGATPGQYIVPVEAADGGIEGVAKNEADLTLAEYMRAVGKVIAIEDDGRARIIVKVA